MLKYSHIEYIYHQMCIRDRVDDLASHKLAREIRDKIENELTYPGHIKVTVIREIRANEIAK